MVERIRRLFGTERGKAPGLLIKGIGDDAAVLRAGRNRYLVISSDAFWEGNHFLRQWHHPAEVGYKALARAVSDLAAMGAVPTFFLMNLALPGTYSERWVDQFLQGVNSAARQFCIRLIGGDTTRPLRRPLFAANLTVLGETRGYAPLLRSNARPGDLLFISGEVGGAQIGLEMMRRRRGRARQITGFLQKHLRPNPRLKLGAWLARSGRARAVIDISDGLSSDLANLCRASGVGAVVDGEKLPKAQLPRALRMNSHQAAELYLHGGDDYELLFAVSPKNQKKIPSVLDGVSLTHIGHITRKKMLVLKEGRTSRRLPPKGWDPFRKK